MHRKEDANAVLRGDVRRLEAELAARPDPGSRDRNAAALQRVTFNLDKAKADLEEEREMRRSVERRLEEWKKGINLPGQPLRVPEPPPPPKPRNLAEEKARDDATRRMMEKLDGKLDKLETRKQTHEERMAAEIKECHKQIEKLTRELKAANAVAMQRASLVGSGPSPRGTVARAVGASPRVARLQQQQHAPQPQLRPGSPRDAMISAALGMGGARERDDACSDRPSLGPPMTKDEKVVERLGMLDHGAAVALVERKEAIAQLRARLVNAQAQSAAEATEAGLRGSPELIVAGGQHGRLSIN